MESGREIKRRYDTRLLFKYICNCIQNIYLIIQFNEKKQWHRFFPEYIKLTYFVYTIGSEKIKTCAIEKANSCVWSYHLFFHRIFFFATYWIKDLLRVWFEHLVLCMFHHCSVHRRATHICIVAKRYTIVEILSQDKIDFECSIVSLTFLFSQIPFNRNWFRCEQIDAFSAVEIQLYFFSFRTYSILCVFDRFINTPESYYI